METYTDGPYKPFREETADALLDLEGILVELGTASGTVKVATSAATAIGVIHQKRAGSSHVTIRVLGSGGSFKAVAGGAIAKGSLVTWGAGGKFVTAASGNVLGRKLSQGTSATNDVIEIIDQPRTV